MKPRDFPSPLPEHDFSFCTEREQKCVWLYTEDELTQQQIGQQLGISKQAVSKHLKRALATILGERPRRAKMLSIERDGVQDFEVIAGL